MTVNASGPDLSAERIQAELRTARYGRSLRVVALTDSTNDDALRDAAAGAADGHVVVADAQRSGRGSHGRNWASPAGTDLYVSIVAQPRLSPAQLPTLTLAVGLGVADAAEQLLADAAVKAQVKWPNDVWLNGKKCAGILVEARSSLAPVVIGVGLNVNRLQFPPELASAACSLRLARPGSAPFDRAATLAQLLLAIERSVDRLVAEGPEVLMLELSSRLALRGVRVRCAEREGSVVGIAPSGALRLLTDHGLIELLAGRIELP
ncbi:MAG TPA: biotin--[acetyl-CoA-carboxylase] ligase [Polyangiales bacterium]|nr:biotin--[acetyl-CoA-carboxylase] ligase [Polyangiales bacterium]